MQAPREVAVSRRARNQTRAASSPSVRLLLRPLKPDAVFNSGGRGPRPRGAYDAGLRPPPYPDDSPAIVRQTMPQSEVVELLREVNSGFWDWTVLRRGLRKLLGWLEGFDGDSWEERWLSSGADHAPRSWRAAVFSGRQLGDVATAANALMLARILRPSYSWQLNTSTGWDLPARFLQRDDPVLFDQLRSLPAFTMALLRHQTDALTCLSRVMIRTGCRLDQLTGEHLLHYADTVKTSGRHRREHLAWELMVALGPFADEPLTMRAAWSAKGNSRQHSVATLVDRYGIPAGGVRDLLVDYLGELRPSMDYASLQGWAYRLVRLFWWEVLQINPDQRDLRLDPHVATQWRERLAITTDGLPRREIHSILFAVRGMYRDLAEWSHDDPARWGTWVAPCPVSRHESKQASKAKRRQQSRTQDRTRMLAPHLPRLVAEADRRRTWSAQMLETATATSEGSEFTVDGATFLRPGLPEPKNPLNSRSEVWIKLMTPTTDMPAVRIQRGLINATALEADGFWAWAIVEVLRHTGIRIEELLELNQLSIRQYTSTTTGTIVPLLHIVPSKNDRERLIPMSPDLVTTLLAVQRRAKIGHSTIPLSIRYDPHEKSHGRPFPHLFARKVGARQEVISGATVRRLLNDLADSAGLIDVDGTRIRFTPHDFRRLFTTEMISTGLPIHIAATLLGHLNLETTRGYTAVYPEEVIEAHRHFIDRRRNLRPYGEFRDASDEEWQEFEDHFLLRTVALGECHRPYGTPCVHEHACARCRFLRVDPAQLPRITDMINNTEERLDEARERTWLGEVAALEDSLQHLRRRQTEAQVATENKRQTETAK